MESPHPSLGTRSFPLGQSKAPAGRAGPAPGLMDPGAGRGGRRPGGRLPGRNEPEGRRAGPGGCDQLPMRRESSDKPRR